MTAVYFCYSEGMDMLESTKSGTKSTKKTKQKQPTFTLYNVTLPGENPTKMSFSDEQIAAADAGDNRARSQIRLRFTAAKGKQDCPPWDELRRCIVVSPDQTDPEGRMKGRKRKSQCATV